MAHVTISDYTPRESFTVGGTPSSGPFVLPAGFVVFDPSTDIKVYDDGVLLTYSAAPTLATEWSFTGTLIDGGYMGGSVSLGANITSSTVVIVRDIPIARATDFPYPSENLDIEALNTQFDMLFAIFQDREDRGLRNLRQPDSDPTNIDTIPAVATRANMLLGFDADGDPIAATTTTATVSAYMEDALTSANEAALKAYINAEAGTDFLAPTGDGSGLVKMPYGRGLPLINGKIVASVAANALTVAIKTLAGADPSASDPVYIVFPDETAATGAPDLVTITSATSLTVPSGAELGFSANTAARLWVVGFNSAAAFGGLGVIKALGAGSVISALNESDLRSAVAVGTGSDSANTIYASGTVTSKPFRILGHLTWNSGLATPGTWGTAPSVVHQITPHSKRPGDVVQSAYSSYAAVATGTTVTDDDDSIPQVTQGDEYMARSIIPSSAANLLQVTANAWFSQSADSNITAHLHRDDGTNAVAAVTRYNPSNAQLHAPFSFNYLAIAGSVASTEFQVRCGPGGAATVTFNGVSGGRLMGGVFNSWIEAKEIMT